MRRDSITIVLVPETREPLTMEFSLRELLFILLLLLAIFGSAGYSIFRFRNLRNEYSLLNSSLYTLRADLKEKEVRLQDLKVELESKKGLILLVDGKRDTTVLSGEITSPEIKVEDLQVQPGDHNLSLEFRLTNIRTDEHILNGYLMVIAEHESGDLDKYGTFPDFSIIPAQPVEYSQGDSYSIRRFKQVDAVVPLKDRPENYKSFKILAFNGDGEVLLNDSRVLRW